MTSLEACLKWAKSQSPLQSTPLHFEVTREIAVELDLTTFSCPVVTVGGTNGKGSTVALLEAIYLAAGYRVATLTSPHLMHFCERIRFNGLNVPEHDVCMAYAMLKAHVRSPLSYFQLVTLAALLLFRQYQPSLILLEVGLGGRCDATNVVENDIAVLTSIALDHQDRLGHTCDAIAYEKSGIMRSDRIAVCGENMPLPVHEEAAKKNVSMQVCGRDFFYKKQNDAWQWQGANVCWNHLPVPLIHLNNAALALAVCEQLYPRCEITITAVAEGLKTVFVPGRLQWLDEHILVDVAHNVASCAHLAQQLQSSSVIGKTWAIAGFSDGKDIQGMLSTMQPVIDEWLPVEFSDARTLPQYQLIHHLDQEKMCYRVLGSCVSETYHALKSHLEPGDRLVVFGSFFTVSDMLSVWEKESKQ